MTVPISIDVKDLLVGAGVAVFGDGGDSGAWSLFIGSEPDIPNDCLTIYDTPGDPPNPKFLLDYPHFQIRVRSDDYAMGFSKALEARDVLLGIPSQDIDGTRYVGIWITIDTHFLKSDEKGRRIFVTNFRAITEPAAGTNREPL